MKKCGAKLPGYHKLAQGFVVDSVRVCSDAWAQVCRGFEFSVHVMDFRHNLEMPLYR